jgi:hypothetical protein
MERHVNLLGLEKWGDEAVKKTKTQGAEKLYKLLQENPLWIEVLEKEISRMINP